METTLIAALITVLIIGLPLGILMGRSSAPQSGGQKNTGPAPIGGAPIANTIHTTHFWKKKWFWTVVSIAAVIIVVIALIFQTGILAALGSGLPNGELSFPMWSTSTGLLIGGILLFVGFFIKKGKGVLMLLGALIVILTLAFSGFGEWAKGEIHRAETCASTGDCRSRVGNSPVTGTGGIIDIARGSTESFLVEGIVAIRNHRNYCLNISPQGTFKMSWSDDARIYYIEPRSSNTEMATVTSLPRGTADCR